MYSRVYKNQKPEIDVGPSGVRALPLAAVINVGGHYKWYFFSFFVCVNFGPSGVRALPLAAGINVGGHYEWHFFLLSPGSLLILPEGLVVGFLKFAWAPR